MRVNLLTASCTKTQSVEMSPMPTSTTTVGEPWPVQCKCILWPATSRSFPGALGTGGSDCADTASGKTATRKSKCMGTRPGMEIPPVEVTKDAPRSSLTSRNLEGSRRSSARLFSVLREGSAFARDEDGRGRLDVELFGKVALIYRDPDSPTRVLIKERIAHRNVHKRFAEGKNKRLAIQQKTDFVADCVAE